MQTNSDTSSESSDSTAKGDNKSDKSQKNTAPQDKENLSQSEQPQSSMSENLASSKKSSSDGVLYLHQIISMSGMNLTRTLATLAARRGKQAAYAEPSNEDRDKEITQLVKDSKAASRLRIILVTGLQQGAKKLAMHPFWADALDIIDQYLRRINSPLALSLAIKQCHLTASDYRMLWLSLTDRDKSKKIYSLKELIAIQELLVLDVCYAYWKNLIDEGHVLEALAAFEFADTTNLPHRPSLPWRASTALATTLPATVIVSQANSIHNALASAQYALLTANSRIDELVDELSLLTKQFDNTRNELSLKTLSLINANDKITQLQSDVKSAGSIHKHKADELRSRFKGIMEGDIDRHLRTIQRAADMNPPRANVIIERVETLLETLTRELKWLEDTE